MQLELIGDENALYTPEIKFIDPGTGPTETWDFWLDVDDSETLTPLDITGPITTTTVINDVTHGTLPSMLLPFNDDYKVWIVDSGNNRIMLFEPPLP